MSLLRRVIGGVLRRLRLRQGRTLREVAESAGVSVPYLSEVERGRKEASSEVLAAICRALGIHLSDLLEEARDELRRVEPRTPVTPPRVPTARRGASDVPRPSPAGPRPAPATTRTAAAANRPGAAGTAPATRTPGAQAETTRTPTACASVGRRPVARPGANRLPGARRAVDHGPGAPGAAGRRRARLGERLGRPDGLVVPGRHAGLLVVGPSPR